MKRNLLLLAALFIATMVSQAQFYDFGEQFDAQKGDFAVADIDGDGDMDIIFSGENNGGLEIGAIWINDGTGNFTEQGGDRVIKIGRSGNIQFGDIDGDGDLDVIFGGWYTSASPSVGIALNDGHGVFTLATQYPVNTAQTVTAAGFADFNMDGLLDYYFFANGLGNCKIYFQQPDGTFEESNASFANCNFVEPEVTIVDFDNDTYPDIFITAYDEIGQGRFSALFKNDGFGTFVKFEGVDIYRKKANGTTSWGDFNGDGYMDLLLNGDGYLNSGEDNDGIARIYKNMNGSATSVGAEFEWYRQNGVGNGSVIVDWDNDGKLDFFLGGWNGSKQETALYLGDNPTNFTFAKSPLSDTYFPGISEQGFRVADLNGDNKVDLLICGYSGGTMDLGRRITAYVLNQSEKASVVPAAPTNLDAVVDESDGVMVTFSWAAPESETGKQGTTYNFSLKNTTTGKWLYNPMAIVGGDKNGWRKVAGRMGNVYLNKRFELYDLPNGEYEWTVQAINGAYLGGAFAQTKTFTITKGWSGVESVVAYKPTVTVFNKTLNVNGTPDMDQLIKIYNISGSTVFSTVFSGNVSFELPVATGVYVVELTKDGAVPFRTKIVVK